LPWPGSAARTPPSEAWTQQQNMACLRLTLNPQAASKDGRIQELEALLRQKAEETPSKRVRLKRVGRDR